MHRPREERTLPVKGAHGQHCNPGHRDTCTHAHTHTNTDVCPCAHRHMHTHGHTRMRVPHIQTYAQTHACAHAHKQTSKQLEHACDHYGNACHTVAQASSVGHVRAGEAACHLCLWQALWKLAERGEGRLGNQSSSQPSPIHPPS